MKHATVMLIFALSITACAQAAAQEPPAEQKPPQAAEAAQRAEMRREVEEAARAIDAYSVARRADAAKRAQQAMGDMDRRLRQFQAEWSAEAKRIGENTKTNRERALAEARERRAELEKRYRQMQESNAQAWTRARDGFVRAYRDLAAALGMQRAEPEAADESEKEAPKEPKAP